MEKKLCGIDLNAVQDYVARNWIKDKSGEDIFLENTNLGSSRSSVISLKTQLGIEYIGGVQADLAPHGRGEGYGGIGNPKYRVMLRDIIKSEEPCAERLSAAVLGVTPPSDFAICGISDSEYSTEAYQDALLLALRKAKFKNPLLVWRSVLASIAMVENGAASAPCSIGVMSHSNLGLDIQKLELKTFNHLGSKVLVPERKQLGASVKTDFGYDTLFSLAYDQLEAFNTDRFLDVGPSKNIAALGLGRSVKSELLRSRNSLWRKLTPPSHLSFADVHLSTRSEYLQEHLNACDLLVFETFTEGRMRSRIHGLIESNLGREVELLFDDTIAKAALFAADRYSKNVPIYFDYLPQISTIIQKGRQPTNFNLIDQSETLRAGSVYRSKEPAILGTQAGQHEIEIYLKKEEDEHPRQATIDLPVIATSTHSVSVYVEQTPAQGKAAIQINAVDLGLSQTIDFQTAQKLDVTWDALLANIKIGSCPIPERMVLPAFIENWQDSFEEGLTAIIDREVKKEQPDWVSLEKKIGRAVSSDGDLPKSINAQTDHDLAVLTQRAHAHFQGRLEGSIRANNISLRFLTWQFKRCPQEVCSHLIDFWEHYGEENFKHPLIRNIRSWNLLFQGVGRAVFDPELEERALFELLNTPIKNWHWEAQTACASFLVSRSKTAHKLLDTSIIEEFLERVKIEFSENLRTNYREFRYAPFLLAGLLRYREINTQFLVQGSDPRADEFIDILQRTLNDISRSRSIKNYDRNKFNYWLSEIVKFIKCEGGNPKLLMDISNNRAA